MIALFRYLTGLDRQRRRLLRSLILENLALRHQLLGLHTKHRDAVCRPRKAVLRRVEMSLVWMDRPASSLRPRGVK